MERLEYFRKSFVVTGKHSQMVDDMWKQNQIQESYFNRLVDIYPIAAVIGLRMKRRADVDSGEGKRTIQSDQMTTKLEELEVMMQIVLLLDESSGRSAEEKIDRAFRGPRTKEEFDENVELFDSYVRGGIEVLHELLVQRALGVEDEYNDVRIGNIVALLENPLIGEI